MNILSLPNDRIVDSSGNITTPWRVYLEQLTNQLQQSFLDIGWKVQSAGNDVIDGLVASDLSGALIFNNESKNMQVNTEGSYKPINTYEQKTTADIADIPSGQRNGRFIYDTDTGQLKVGFNDNFNVVTTT